MKRFIYVCIICLITLIVSGCGKKEVLTCTIDQSDQLYNQGTAQTKYELHFDGNSLSKMNYYIDINITAENLKEADIKKFETNLQTICDEGLTDIKLSKCNVTVKDKNISLTGTAMKKDFKNQNDTNGSSKKTKEKLEAHGYKCSIAK